MTDKITLEKVLERLSKLPPIEDLTEEDREFYSEIGKALMKSELEHLIERKNWVLGVLISASMLEFAGQIRLIWKYKGSISSNKIRNLNLATTIMSLFTSKIVNERTYHKMEKIRDTRNSFAHDLLRDSFSHKPNPDLERLIREVIRIIEILF